MKNRLPTSSFGTLMLLLVLMVFSPAIAQTAPATTTASPSENGPQSPEEENVQPGQVIIEGRGPILTVYETVAGRSPEERAKGIEQRIITVAKEGGASIPVPQLRTHHGWTEILIGSQTIMAVTDGDARMAGTSRDQLAALYAENILQAIPTYRREHSWRMVLNGVLDTGLATLVLLSLLWLLRRVRLILRARIERQIHISSGIEQKSAWHILVAYAGPISLALGALVRWLLILGLIQAYLTVSMGFFSFTREISLTVTRWVFSQLALLAQAGLDYSPNLLVIAVIALSTHYVFRLLRLIFSQIEKGELKIHGFYPDWAEPTEKLVRVLVLVLALIVAFPYLPGAKSPAFQGISIFLGVLLSLGSSSAVANAIAGVILTYMRSFLVGDWVQIGDTTGKVVEKNLLVTRVLTPKAEIITIPNATVMSGAVKNYSLEAKKAGVIFHTNVTIGYDAPWRTVHQLLINAALATEHVLQHPAPFVLQNGLNDFYVSYELNAYTDTPARMLNIFSDLHQNIQDKFNEVGMEICSPHFSALRDGNVIAIPESYVQANYKAPAFRVNIPDSADKNALSANRVESYRPTG